MYDPFAGHNSRMELVFRLNRTYIGVDISRKFMRMNRRVKHMLERERREQLLSSGNCIYLIEGDSANVSDLEDGMADFSITSPPYWDLEYYGDESAQLGKRKTYKDFLNGLQKHVDECFGILKSGAFCVWCVNDFTKGGKFYPFHSDVISLFRNSGFLIHSVYIIDLGETHSRGVRTVNNSG